MHIYLPIAELSANAFGLLMLGGVAGIFSGLFGIGGGFILTPLLIFMDVPPAIAVATSANMIIASSFSGFLSHLKHKRVDIDMGNWLVAGGMGGALIGVWIFAKLKRAGQIDLMISVLYILLLGTIGVLMFREARRMYMAARRGEPQPPQSYLHLPAWVERLPWQKQFVSSNVTHSVLVPMALGLLSGLIVAMLGVGGGVIMIPAMIYILRMPNNVTTGTSLYQIIFITAVATLLHAITTHSVDIVLAALLLVGSAIGAQWGVRWSRKLPTYALRGLMASLLLLMVLRLAYGLFITPENLFTLTVAGS
ncbi:MAG: permease [Azospirillum brasilense]|nr:MAG: permease [Azospirillum brasilense]